MKKTKHWFFRSLKKGWYGKKGVWRAPTRDQKWDTFWSPVSHSIIPLFTFFLFSAAICVPDFPSGFPQAMFSVAICDPDFPPGISWSDFHYASFLVGASSLFSLFIVFPPYRFFAPNPSDRRGPPRCPLAYLRGLLLPWQRIEGGSARYRGSSRVGSEGGGKRNRPHQTAEDCRFRFPFPKATRAATGGGAPETPGHGWFQRLTAPRKGTGGGARNLPG